MCGLLLSTTRQGSDRGMGRMRALVLVITKPDRLPCSADATGVATGVNLQGLSVWICAVVQLQPPDKYSR